MERVIKPVSWTKRAIKDLKKVRAFYIELYGLEKAKQYVQQIYDATKVLESPDYNFTTLGAIDEYFSHLKHEYRKIYKHYCKITYREGKDKIYINRVFEMRQNPKKNK